MFWLEAFLRVCVVTIDRLRQEYEDSDLIALSVAKGDDSKEAFQVLVERHQGWIVGFLTRLLSSQSDAEDLAQNVFVRAFFALPKFRGDSSFRTWLRVIASREAYNHHRKRGDRPTDPMDFDHMAGDTGAQGRFDDHEALNLALGKVPYPYREILVLRYIEELSIDEIGNVLELGTSATKMRLKRAREHFHTAWDKNVA